MANSASLDVSYSPGDLYPSIVVRALLLQGWRADDLGKIFYAGAGVDDWTDVGLDRLDEVLEEMDTSWEGGDSVGIALVWEDSEVGGQFLFGRGNEFSFLANINRRTLERSAGFTDISWYVERILPALRSLGQDVESVKSSEHV